MRGLFPPEHVDRLRDDIDSAFDGFEEAKVAAEAAEAAAAAADADATGAAGAGAANPGRLRAEPAGWYAPYKHHMITDSDRKRKWEHGNLLAFESPPAMFDLIETMNDVGVGKLADDYFGEPPMVLGRKVTLRRMPKNAGGGWHQDGAFMGADTRSLNVWLALTHCGDDAPGLDVVGRRFDALLPTGNGAYADWGIKPEDAEAAGAGIIVRPIFEAGDALIFDHLLLHRTGRDAGMKNGRYAIETWFFAPSTYGVMTTPLEEGYSPRDQVPLVF